MFPGLLIAPGRPVPQAHYYYFRHQLPHQCFRPRQALHQHFHLHQHCPRLEQSGHCHQFPLLRPRQRQNLHCQERQFRHCRFHLSHHPTLQRPMFQNQTPPYQMASRQRFRLLKCHRQQHPRLLEQKRKPAYCKNIAQTSTTKQSNVFLAFFIPLSEQEKLYFCVQLCPSTLS